MIKPYIKDFINYISFEKGYSKNTILVYKHNLVRFEMFCARQEILSLEDVDESKIRKFLSELHDLGLEATTREHNLYTLRSLFRFLKKERIISFNPLLDIERPKKSLKLVDILTVEEALLMIETPVKSRSNRMKYRAIFELLYGSGLRVTEICDSRVKDIVDGMIRVMGKGNKERIVPISKYSIKAIESYWNHERKDLKQNDYVFTNRWGSRCSRILIYNAVKNHARYCGIKKRVSPHTFRHSFATHMMDNGADIRVIQDMLGHESISSTEYYLHLSKKKLSESFVKHHPRNNGEPPKSPFLFVFIPFGYWITKLYMFL